MSLKLKILEHVLVGFSGNALPFSAGFIHYFLFMFGSIFS